MIFDPNNNVVKLCAKGMESEGEPEKASALFLQAWNEADGDLEKCIAAHYVARHQNTVNEKLSWDIIALEHAEKVNDEEIKSFYPSLYLNIAKCHEDMNDFVSALNNYRLAESYSGFLQNDGYGSMIKTGIRNGIERVSGK